jgi:predicted secreted protein
MTLAFLKMLKLARMITSPGNRDVRSRRMVAVIDCVLNQNVRDAGAAVSPAMNWDVLTLCREHDIGIMQMPCPEQACLGLARTRQAGQSIRDVLNTEAGRQCCAQLAGATVDRIQSFVEAGYQVLAVLGGNPGSPGCAVHHGANGLLDTSGIFIRALQAELERRHIELPMLAIRDHDTALLRQDVEQLRQLLTTPSRS